MLIVEPPLPPPPRLVNPASEEKPAKSLELVHGIIILFQVYPFHVMLPVPFYGSSLARLILRT